MAAQHMPEQRHEVSHSNFPAAGDRTLEYLANSIENAIRASGRQGRGWPCGEDVVKRVEGEHRPHARVSTTAPAALSPERKQASIASTRILGSRMPLIRLCERDRSSAHSNASTALTPRSARAR